MPSLFEQKQTALKTVGMKIVDKLTSSAVDPVLNASPDNLIKDYQGCYNVNHLSLDLQNKGELFAGDEKILSWYLSQTNDLIVDIYCSEQVNLWEPFNLKNLFINSRAPLFLGGSVNCAQSVVIKAHSLAFGQAVHCEQSLIANCENGMVLLAPITCKRFIAHSGAIYQFEKLKTEEQTDLTATIYTSSPASELISPSLKLVANSVRIAGQAHITEKCFVWAGMISLGQLDNKNDILFAGDIRISADYLDGLGATQIAINAKEHTSSIKVNNHMDIDANVYLSVDNVTFHFDGANINGVLQCTKTQLSLNVLSNSGLLRFQDSNLVINQSYTSQNGGLLELAQTQALIQEQCCIDGKITYHKSMVVGQNLFVLSGSLNITEGSSVCIIDELQVCENASFEMNTSCLEAGKEVCVRGICEIIESKITTPLLTCESEKIKAEDFTFSSSKLLTLSGKLDLVKGSIDALGVAITGPIKLDETRIWCDRLQLTTDNGLLNHLDLLTSHWNVVGGKKPEDVRFTNSNLTAEHFISKKHLTLDTTSLYLIGNEKSIQSLGKEVVLESSKIISMKPIIQTEDGKLVLHNHSSLSTPVLLAQGEVISDFSVIFCDRLSQIQGAFTATHTNLYLNEQFAAMQSDVEIADNSKCIVPTINFLSNTQAALNNSILVAQNSVTADALSLTDATLITSKMKAHGATQINHSDLSAEDLHIYNAFDVSNQSQISAEALITAAKKSLITVNDSKIQTKSLDISGQVTLSEAQLLVDEKLRVKSEGDLVLEPGSIIMSEYLAVMGQMHVTQKDVLDDAEVEKEQSVPAQLRINDKFIISSKAKLDGNAPLVAEVGEFLNFGSINLSDSLTARGTLLYNSGNLEADAIYFGFDDAVVNTGMLAANNMTVHSNFINPLGQVYVKESMNCSGFYGFNLGLICANNYSNTTLLSLDGGLVLPNLSADLNYIFSVGNVLSAGRTILSTMTPGYSNLINFACMVPSGIQAASSFYDLCKDKNLDDLKNMRRHEWMPLVGQLHGLGMLGFNVFTTGYHAGGEFKNLSTKGLFSGFAVPKWSDIGLKAATIFTGSYRNTSLIHLNMGVSLAGSTNHSSLLHLNTGIEASILSHSINTHWLYNEGISTGAESSFTASDIVNNGTMSGGASLFVSADTFTNKEGAILSGHNAMVKVSSMKQEGTLRLDEGMLHADELKNTGVITLEKMALELDHVEQNNTLALDTCGGELKHFETQESATTSIQNSALKGASFEDKGQLDLTNVSLEYSERFEVDKDAKVTSSDVTIKTANFKNAGDWEYKNVLLVNAQKAEISEGGIINGQKTNESDLFVEKEKKLEENLQDKPSEGQDEKTFNPKHVFVLNADEGLIDGQLSGGDYTQIRGVQPEKVEGATEEPEIKKNHEITFGDNARIDLRYGSLQTDAMNNKGQVHLDSFSLDIGHLSQQGILHIEKSSGTITQLSDTKNANTVISQSALKGDSASFEGHLDATNSSFNYQTRFELQDTAKTHTNNVSITTQTFREAGELQYEQYLEVNADNALIEKGAIIRGEQTSESELFVEKDKKPEENEQDTPSQGQDDKTFNPKHMFILNADKGFIDGQLSGGDYTQIRGVQPKKEEGATEEPEVKKSHEITFGDNARIDLRYGSLQTDAMKNTGQVHLDSFSLDIGHLSQQGFLNIEKSSGTITQLSDTKNANTVISQSALKGDSASFEGHLDANNSSFDYQTRFELQDTAKAHTNNVSITTQTFREAGELQYEQYLEVNADNALIEKGAIIRGEQTSEDQLFQEKPKDPALDTKSQSTEEKPESGETPPADEKPTEEKKEPEKEFKPQHVLFINTRTLKVDGELSGGDYTKINGKTIVSNEASEVPKETSESKCELIEIGNTAKINLQYGNITSQNLHVDGNLNVSSFDLQIDHTNISNNGHLELSKTKLTGVELVNAGECKFTDTSVEMSSHITLENSACEQLANVSFKTTQFIDHSQMSEQGQVIISTDAYVHDGKIVACKSEQEGAPANLLYVESKTAQLKGEAVLDSAMYNVENFNEAENLLRGDGQYNKYQFSTTLGVETNKDIYLNGQINRACGLHLKGKSVTVNTNYSTEQDLTFISSEGNITLSGQLHGGNVYGKSEKGITSAASVHANALINLEAKEGFYNNAGTLNGDQVAVKAQSITNYRGVINGRSDVYLDATGGNIENQGGMIRGGKYTQLTATGDVKNLCHLGSHWNGFDWVYDYDSGLIAGGTGENTNDVGLYIKACGKVISDASDFVSDGINYIEGDKGLEFGARQQTYVANQWTTKKWYGKKKTHTEVVTQVKGSTVHSAKGANILRTEHGGLESVATQFSSPGGTQIYARDDVHLYNIKAQNRTYDTKRSLWGLKKSSHYERHEEVTPTLFVDNGLTRIVSSEGSIDAKGALFVGAGDLEMEAKHRIQFGCDTLDHTIIDKQQGIGISMPGFQAYNTIKAGGNWIDAVTAEDATVAKINRLAHSENTAEVLANASNLGVNLYNTSNSVMRGLGNDTLSKEMLSRYGLGGADGFSPTLTLSMTKTQTISNYQTLGAGGVDRGGNVILKAGDGIDLENGVRVHAGGNIDIDAPELIEHSAALHSSIDQKTQTASLSVTASGIQGASYSESRMHAQATNHVNAELSAGGNIRLHHGDGAIKSVILDGGNISCKTLDADIEHLTIISQQDTSESNTLSFGASTNGQVSFYEGNTRSKITNQHSGIHVEEGINNNGHTVHVGEAYMEGGKITTNGQNNIVIDKLTTVELHDESHASGFGISVNLNDLGRLAGQQSTNQTGEQAIAIAEFTYEHVNYQATQTAVIHGVEGTNIVIGQLDGNLHTTSADGCTITKNEATHLVLDIPITNKSYIESASQNFKAGIDKLNTLFGRNVSLDAIPEKPVAEIVQTKKLEEIEDVFLTLEEKDVIGDNEVDENIDNKLTLEEKKQALEIKTNEAIEEAKNAGEAYKKNRTKENKAKYDKAKKQAIVLIKEYVAMAMGAYPAKEFTKRYTVIVNLIFNLCGASIDKKEGIIREAIMQSGSDFVLAKMISDIAKVGGEALGTGIGVGLVVLSAIDALFYDQKRVDKTINSGLDDLYRSQDLANKGQYLDSLNAQLIASQKIGMASRAQAGHIALDFVNTLFERGVENLRNINTYPIGYPVTPTREGNHRFFKPQNNEYSEQHAKENRQAMSNIE